MAKILDCLSSKIDFSLLNIKILKQIIVLQIKTFTCHMIFYACILMKSRVYVNTNDWLFARISLIFFCNYFEILQTDF